MSVHHLPDPAKPGLVRTVSVDPACMPAPPDPPRHIAKFPKRILETVFGLIADEADRLGRAPIVVDPFCGVGMIHDRDWFFDEAHLWPTIIGGELELDYAIQSGQRGPTIVADATNLPFPDASVDVIATSPVYGNRMSDHHDAKERCKACEGRGWVTIEGLVLPEDCEKCDGAGRRVYTRNTYKHALGHDLHPNNAGAMLWGPAYRALHEDAWYEAGRVLRPGGLAVVNIKNHLKTVGPKGRRVQVEQLVAEWHLNTWLRLGYGLHSVTRIGARGNRQGANHQARVDAELVLAVRKPLDPATKPRLQ